MLNFYDYIAKYWDIQVPKDGDIPGSWFQEHNIPMVVRCCCCDMSMASPSALIDDSGFTYCGSCASVSED